MSYNPYTKSIETKLYFIVFVLFSSFLSILIYNFSIDTIVMSDVISEDGADMLLQRRGAAGNQQSPPKAADVQGDNMR